MPHRIYLFLLFLGVYGSLFAQDIQPEALLREWKTSQQTHMIQLDSVVVDAYSQITIDSPRGLFKVTVVHQAIARRRTDKRLSFMWTHRILRIQADKQPTDPHRLLRRIPEWRLGQHLLQQLFFPLLTLKPLHPTHVRVADTLDGIPAWRLELVPPPESSSQNVPFRRFTVWFTQHFPPHLLQARMILPQPGRPPQPLASVLLTFLPYEGIDIPEHLHMESIRTRRRRIRTYTYITTLDMQITARLFFHK